MTVCFDCWHFKGDKSAPWYAHFCGARPLPTAVDPVTGQVQAYAGNDLNRAAFVDRGFAYCRDVNDGECPEFERRAWWPLRLLEGVL